MPRFSVKEEGSVQDRPDFADGIAARARRTDATASAMSILDGDSARNGRPAGVPDVDPQAATRPH
jgi:hypothetical protein